MEYLEEIYPSPSLLGETPEQRAQTPRHRSGCQRDLTVLHKCSCTRSSSTSVPSRIVQHRQVGEALQPWSISLDQLEERIGNQSFLAGPRPTSPIARSLR